MPPGQVIEVYHLEQFKGEFIAGRWRSAALLGEASRNCLNRGIPRGESPFAILGAFWRPGRLC